MACLDEEKEFLLTVLYTVDEAAKGVQSSMPLSGFVYAVEQRSKEKPLSTEAKELVVRIVREMLSGASAGQLADELASEIKFELLACNGREDEKWAEEVNSYLSALERYARKLGELQRKRLLAAMQNKRVDVTKEEKELKRLAKELEEARRRLGAS